MPTYREGFIEGWKAIRGGSAMVPQNATYSPSQGRSPFQEGVRRAVLKALAGQGKLVT
jgi:hypothetical protein